MPDQTKFETAVFGGGCFWCTEAVFRRLRGVSKTVPGYTGGTSVNPAYNDLHERDTGHVEALRVEFDPTQISYGTLLDVFFGTHDPTTLNRQGNDSGPQYRSVIYFTDETQKALATQKITRLTTDQVFNQPIVTTIEPLKTFYPAEPEHRDYYEKNQQNPYCQVVISPKIAKLRQHYAQFLKGGNDD